MASYCTCFRRASRGSVSPSNTEKTGSDCGRVHSMSEQKGQGKSECAYTNCSPHEYFVLIIAFSGVDRQYEHQKPSKQDYYPVPGLSILRKMQIPRKRLVLWVLGVAPDVPNASLYSIGSLFPYHKHDCKRTCYMD
jgi:hypothetical protein